MQIIKENPNTTTTQNNDSVFKAGTSLPAVYAPLKYLSTIYLHKGRF